MKLLESWLTKTRENAVSLLVLVQILQYKSISMLLSR